MTPLSSDDDARARQLANLKPGAGAAGLDNERARQHGGYATVAADRLDAKVVQVFHALGDDLPLRAADGGVPPADAARVRLMAEALCRADDVADFLRRRGLEDKKGNLRVAVLDLERRLRAEAADHGAALGLDPRARAALGLDLARSFDLAKHWADQGDDAIDGSATNE